MSKNPRLIWLRRLALVVVIYAGLAAMAHFTAESSLYFPLNGSYRKPEGLIKIQTNDGGNLAAVYLPNPTARFTIWFFHGNAEDLGNAEPLLKNLHDAGFAVFAFDYPGYGFSSGYPSEQAIYSACHEARDYLRKVLKIPVQQTVLYGRSLGGGPAVQMATEEHVGGLILQSTFTSVYRIETHWHLLPFDEFENLKKIPRVNCPVLVMHGREDHLIPFYQGEALYAAARGPKQCLWVDFARHNDLIDVAGDHYWQALRDFSDLCKRNLSK
jgi:fermentation-respiration switch protein FrsA (DUF1100 family)